MVMMSTTDCPSFYLWFLLVLLLEIEVDAVGARKPPTDAELHLLDMILGALDEVGGRAG